MKLKFKQFNWPEIKDTLLRKIIHGTEKLRTLKLSKNDFELNNWRKELLVPADDLAVPADEAPPIVNCDDSPTGEKATSSDVSTARNPVGRPRGSHKRLSDGTCKKLQTKQLMRLLN